MHARPLKMGGLFAAPLYGPGLPRPARRRLRLAPQRGFALKCGIEPGAGIPAGGTGGDRPAGAPAVKRARTAVLGVGQGLGGSEDAIRDRGRGQLRADDFTKLGKIIWYKHWWMNAIIARAGA